MTKKIENKRGRDQALGGRQSIKKRHNQPYDSVSGGGLFEMRCYSGGMYGGDDITSFGRRINRQKLMKEKIRCGLRRPPNNKKKHNNQPKTCGLDGGETRYEAQPAGGAVGVQVDRFWAIELG